MSTGTATPAVFAEDPTRRQVNVLFCDLVGSTELAGRLDPEEYQEILDRYRESVSVVIRRHDGHLHHTLGDGLMASWGHPRAHEDDAVRAVLAGLDAVDAVRSVNTTPPRTGGIRVRVGIHTGIAVVSDLALGDLREQGNVAGETPNVAARLQSVGAPGTVVISEATCDLVGDRFELSDLGSPELHGVARPLRVFAVRRPKGPLPIPPLVARQPVVGRERETALLDAAWRRVTAGATETVEIVGDAGMGKSRLVQHVGSAVQAGGHPAVMVRCSPLWTHTAFEAMRQFLLGAVGAALGDTADRTGAALRGLFDRTGVTDAPTLDALLRLAGVPPAGDDLLTPDERREQTFRALSALVESLTAGAPALVVFDDLQWADPSTAELVRRLVESPRETGRLLVLVEREESRYAGTGAHTLRLGPLEPSAVTALARAVVPGRPDAWYATVVTKSDGVPLFVAELARALAKAGSADVLRVPPRLNDLLVARLDQHPEQRTLLQVLATVGLSAERSLLERVLDRPSDDVRAQLGTLTEAGILQEEGAAHDPTYRFSHVLLQEAAYSTALKRRRRDIHRAVSQRLMAPERVDAVAADLIAHHLERAGDVAASITWWWRSALAASELAAHPETIRHLRHVLDLLPGAEGAHDVEEADVLVLLGGSLVAVEGYTSPEVSRVVERARAVLSSAPESATRSGTYYQLWAYHHVRGELAAAASLSEQLSRRSEDVAATLMRGHDLFEQGDLAGALGFLERGRTLAEAAQGRSLRELTGGVPHDLVAAATVVIGVIQWMTGRRETGRRSVRQAIAHARTLGPPTGAFTRAYVHCYASWWELLAEDPVAAATDAQTSIEEATAHGYNSWLVSASIHGAGAAALLGEAASARATLEYLLGVWRAAGAEAFRPVFLLWLARAHAVDGDLPAAVRVLDEAVEHVDRFGDRLHLPELLRDRGVALRGLGREEAGADELRQAVAEAERQGAWSFAVRALADLVETRPSDREARAALRRALGHVDEPAPAADLLRARALLR